VIKRASFVLGLLMIGLMWTTVAHAEETYDPQPVPYLRSPYVTGDLERDIQTADYIISWQMDHGGWNKNSAEVFMSRPWDGTEAKSGWFDGAGNPLGTIDNNATNDEVLFLALMYRETGEERFKEAAIRGIDFLLNMQYESGGWPQVYPTRGNYSDYVTFNDSAMIRTMNVLTLVRDAGYPFDSDLVDESRRLRTAEALEKGLDYILKSQIIVDGYPTAWCAQHDPVTYEPREGRSYEHPSISGSESVGIVEYLLSLPDPPDEVKKAIVGAIRWFDKVKIDDYEYVQADPAGAYFYYKPGSMTWYRFYEIETFEPIFSGRLGITHNFHQLEQSARDGYRWAGDWATDLIQLKDELPYYKDISYQLDVERYQAIKQAKAEASTGEEVNLAEEANDDRAADTEPAETNGSDSAGAMDNTSGSSDSMQSASEGSASGSISRGNILLTVVISVVSALVMFGFGLLIGMKRKPMWGKWSAGR